MYFSPPLNILQTQLSFHWYYYILGSVSKSFAHLQTKIVTHSSAKQLNLGLVWWRAFSLNSCHSHCVWWLTSTSASTYLQPINPVQQYSRLTPVSREFFWKAFNQDIEKRKHYTCFVKITLASSSDLLTSSVLCRPAYIYKYWSLFICRNQLSMMV